MYADVWKIKNSWSRNFRYEIGGGEFLGNRGKTCKIHPIRYDLGGGAENFVTTMWGGREKARKKDWAGKIQVEWQPE